MLFGAMDVQVISHHVAADPQPAKADECGVQMFYRNALDRDVAAGNRRQTDEGTSLDVVGADTEVGPVEFVHPKDAATALVNVLDRPEAHGRIHLIGGGKDCQVTTLRMMQTLMGALGIAITAEDLGSEPTNAPWVDTTESQRLLSFQGHTVEDLERECYERFKLVRPFVRPLSPLIVRAMKLWLRR